MVPVMTATTVSPDISAFAPAPSLRPSVTQTQGAEEEPETANGPVFIVGAHRSGTTLLRYMLRG